MEAWLDSHCAWCGNVCDIESCKCDKDCNQDSLLPAHALYVKAKEVDIFVKQLCDVLEQFVPLGACIWQSSGYNRGTCAADHRSLCKYCNARALLVLGRNNG